MTSIRRVKKGPGRRPASEKRDRFVQLRERGWSLVRAAREVGISRSTAKNWHRGYKVYREGEVVGFVEPLQRLVDRKVSDRFLSQDERIEIADLRLQGLTMRQIAERVGRSASTISRELRRNAHPEHGYRPFEAHRSAVERRVRHHQRRVVKDPELGALVGDLLAQRWSPEQISRHLRTAFPDDPSRRLCHEAIYQAVYAPGSTLLVPPKVRSPHRSPLRTGRDQRRAQQRPDERQPRAGGPRMTIRDRPFEPTDRDEAGHWEGDLIIGRGQGSAIGTLVERQTRTIRLLHLPARDSATVHVALTARMSDLPAGLLRSITWDQGSEMARHAEITADLGTAVYFCDPHSPWQRGSNENANGLLRQHFPKGTDLSIHTPEHLAAVEEEINRRPRLVLGDKTPAELFSALLIASPNQPLLQR